MVKIYEILGPIEPQDLGFMLMHEHIASVNWSLRQSFPRWLERDQIVLKAVQMIRDAKLPRLRLSLTITSGHSASILWLPFVNYLKEYEL